MNQIAAHRITKKTSLEVDIPQEELLKALDIDPTRYRVLGVHALGGSLGGSRNTATVTLNVEEIKKHETREQV